MWFKVAQLPKLLFYFHILRMIKRDPSTFKRSKTQLSERYLQGETHSNPNSQSKDPNKSKTANWSQGLLAPTNRENRRLIKKQMMASFGVSLDNVAIRDRRFELYCPRVGFKVRKLAKKFNKMKDKTEASTTGSIGKASHKHSTSKRKAHSPAVTKQVYSKVTQDSSCVKQNDNTQASQFIQSSLEDASRKSEEERAEDCPSSLSGWGHESQQSGMPFEPHTDRVIDTEQTDSAGSGTEVNESESEPRSGSLNIVAPSEASEKGIISIKIIESSAGIESHLPNLPQILQSSAGEQSGVKCEGSQTQKMIANNSSVHTESQKNISHSTISNANQEELPQVNGILQSQIPPSTPAKPEEKLAESRSVDDSVNMTPRRNQLTPATNSRQKYNTLQPRNFNKNESVVNVELIWSNVEDDIVPDVTQRDTVIALDMPAMDPATTQDLPSKQSLDLPVIDSELQSKVDSLASRDRLPSIGTALHSFSVDTEGLPLAQNTLRSLSLSSQGLPQIQKGLQSFRNTDGLPLLEKTELHSVSNSISRLPLIDNSLWSFSNSTEGLPSIRKGILESVASQRKMAPLAPSIGKLSSVQSLNLPVVNKPLASIESLGLPELTKQLLTSLKSVQSFDLPMLSGQLLVSNKAADNMVVLPPQPLHSLSCLEALQLPVLHGTALESVNSLPDLDMHFLPDKTLHSFSSFEQLSLLILGSRVLQSRKQFQQLKPNEERSHEPTISIHSIAQLDLPAFSHQALMSLQSVDNTLNIPALPDDIGLGSLRLLEEIDGLLSFNLLGNFQSKNHINLPKIQSKTLQESPSQNTLKLPELSNRSLNSVDSLKSLNESSLPHLPVEAADSKKLLTDLSLPVFSASLSSFKSIDVFGPGLPALPSVLQTLIMQATKNQPSKAVTHKQRTSIHHRLSSEILPNIMGQLLSRGDLALQGGMNTRPDSEHRLAVRRQSKKLSAAFSSGVDLLSSSSIPAICNFHSRYGFDMESGPRRVALKKVSFD